MPDLIKRAFFKWMEYGDPLCNNVYVDWHTEMWTEEAGAAGDWGMSKENEQVFSKVNNWLLANGMQPNEDVIIKYWW